MTRHDRYHDDSPYPTINLQSTNSPNQLDFDFFLVLVSPCKKTLDFLLRRTPTLGISSELILFHHHNDWWLLCCSNDSVKSDNLTIWIWIFEYLKSQQPYNKPQHESSLNILVILFHHHNDWWLLCCSCNDSVKSENLPVIKSWLSLDRPRPACKCSNTKLDERSLQRATVWMYLDVPWMYLGLLKSILIFKKQARKPQSYATSKVRLTHQPTRSQGWSVELLA